MKKRSLSMFYGIIAIIGASLLTISDIIEIIQGGFSQVQLTLTYISFLIFTYILVALQKEQEGRSIGYIGALIFGISYVFWAATVVYPMVEDIANYEQLIDRIGLMYYINGILLFTGTILFAYDVYRVNYYPRWTSIALIVGAVSSIVFPIIGISAYFQLIASSIRSVAFIGIGFFLLMNKDEVNSIY
ncbi:MAG: hypothetical protein ACFFAO_21555 [Candidatus Hermodarchaeota archaeon]